MPRLLPAFSLTFLLPLVLAFMMHAGPFASAENPKAAEAAGAALFRDKGCAYCHGANIQGTPKGPSLEKVRKTMKPDQIASQIKNGGQKVPSFEDSLTSNVITQLVAYLRAKHRPVPPAIPSAQN